MLSYVIILWRSYLGTLPTSGLGPPNVRNFHQFVPRDRLMLIHFFANIPASFKSSVLARNLSRRRHYAASREKDFSHFTTTDWHKAWRRDIHHRTHRRTIPFAQVFFHVKIQHGGASCLSNNLVKSWFVSTRVNCCCYFFNICNYFDLFVGKLCGNWWSRVRLQSFHSTLTSG